MAVGNGALTTDIQAVHACHAAGVVDAVVLEVYARCLAGTGAESAGIALAGVYDRLEPGEAGDVAQHGPYGAEGVAIGASVPPGKDEEDDERCQGNEEGGEALQPDARLIESVAVGAFRQISQGIVAPRIEGGEEVLGDASEGAVGSQQRHERADSCQEGDDEQCQYAKA